MTAIAAGDTPEPVTMSGHTDRVWRVDFSPDGSRLVTSSIDETAKIWNVESGELLATVTGHVGNGERIAALEISPDGTQLATGAGDRSIKVWDLTTTETSIDQPVLTIPVETEFINDVAFSPDGSRLAIGKEDGSIIVWDITGTEGQMLLELIGHAGSTIAVDFSPDGSRLASASADGSVRIWDMTRNGQELLTLSSHTDVVVGVAFSPDGEQVASASFDGTVQVYLLDVDELIALSTSRLTRWWRPEECLRYLHTEECPPAPAKFAASPIS
jgi:WD40 repeat protein